jgi:hypothetical protein
VALKVRHWGSTPQLPLATPKVDPEKIIRKGKAPQEGPSAIIPCDFSNFHNPLETPVSASHSPIIPSIGVSINLNFGSFSTIFSPPSINLEGEIFDTPLSPKFVQWFKPRNLEDFPTLGFTTPPPIKFPSFGEE